MIINGFKLFSKTSSPGRTIIASWHSSHSLTWRWLICWARFKGDEWRVHWPLLQGGRRGSGQQWTLLVPWLGRLEYDTQKSMWYRDIYLRRRYGQDTERDDDYADCHEQRARKANAIRGDAPLH